MDKVELKPCPFCGGELERHGGKKLGYYYYAHPTNDCILANLDEAIGVAIIFENEIEAWNRRGV
jgi:hypothetical protein